MQTICELHQDHADIFGHGQRHFLEILCLGFSTRFEHAAEFADAVDEFCDLLVKLGSELVFCNARVFNNIV